MFLSPQLWKFLSSSLGLLLCLTWTFSLAYFSILSLFCGFCLLTLCHEVFLFWSCLFDALQNKFLSWDLGGGGSVMILKQLLVFVIEFFSCIIHSLYISVSIGPRKDPPCLTYAFKNDCSLWAHDPVLLSHLLVLILCTTWYILPTKLPTECCVWLIEFSFSSFIQLRLSSMFLFLYWIQFSCPEFSCLFFSQASIFSCSLSAQLGVCEIFKYVCHCHLNSGSSMSSKSFCLG